MDIFDGPQSNQLIQDKNFAQSMTPVERSVEYLAIIYVSSQEFPRQHYSRQLYSSS